MATSTSRHYTVSSLSPPKDISKEPVKTKTASPQKSAQDPNFMTFNDLIIKNGYYPLEFLPQNKTLKKLCDQFPHKYYKITHLPGKRERGPWLKQKPVITFLFSRHLGMSRKQFEQKNHISAEIKSPYSTFRKIFTLLKETNKNGISRKSPILELLQAVSTQNFIPADQDSSLVAVPYHLDIYGWIDILFNPTIPSDLQGVPHHHFYVVNRAQTPRLLSYIAQRI